MHGSVTIERVVTYTQVRPGTFLDEEYVFHQVIAGIWDFRMEGRRYATRPGDLILLPPYVLHAVRPVGEDPHVLNVCHFLVNDPLPVLAKAPLVATAPRRIRRIIRHIFREMLDEWRGSALHRPMMLQAQLYLILAHYLRLGDAALAFEDCRHRGWRNVADAVAFIQSHHQDSALSLDGIAAAARLSKAHFSRLFKQCIGLSPYQYLCRYRIERAKELLKNGQLACAQVAKATGHVDVIGFSRSFRRIEGLAPTRWLETTIFPQAT